jgi:hypothetical protein
MPDTPETTTTGTVPEVVEAEPVVEAAVTPVVEGSEELSVLKERLARYEQLVVSPEYAEFLAAKGRAMQTPPQQVRQYTQEEKGAFQDRLNNMPRAEFAAFIRDITIDMVREQLFNPVVQTIVSDKVQGQIAEAAAEFKDYWDYKDDMIRLSNANPALSAKQVYHLARSARGPQAAPAGKPPIRRPSGEAPSSASAAPKATADTFGAAFEKAFQKSGL